MKAHNHFLMSVKKELFRKEIEKNEMEKIILQQKMDYIKVKEFMFFELYKPKLLYSCLLCNPENEGKKCLNCIIQFLKTGKTIEKINIYDFIEEGEEKKTFKDRFQIFNSLSCIKDDDKENLDEKVKLLIEIDFYNLRIIKKIIALFFLKEKFGNMLENYVDLYKEIINHSSLETNILDFYYLKYLNESDIKKIFGLEWYNFSI